MSSVRWASDVVELSGTDPQQLWLVPTNKRVRITKIFIYNADSADHVVTIMRQNLIDSTTKQLLPGIKVAAGSTKILTEDEIPAETVSSSPTIPYAVVAKLDAAVSANNVQIQVEFEES